MIALSTRQDLRALWRHLPLRRKRQVVGLLGLTAVASFTELLSFGALLPFLGALSTPERFFVSTSVQPLVTWWGATSPSQLLLPVTITFCLAAIVAGGMRILLLWANTHVSFMLGHDLGMEIYRRTLHQPYQQFLTGNSSETIGTISNKVNLVIFQIIMPGLTIVGSATMFLCIIGFLLYVNPLVTLIALGGMSMVYGAVIMVTRRRVTEYGGIVARETTSAVKCLQEGLGSIRDIIIDGTQQTHVEAFRGISGRLRLAQAANINIGSSPRYFIETTVMVLIAVLAYVLSRSQGGLAEAIPLLAILVVGAQKLLPLLQQSYSALIGLWHGQASLRDAISMLEMPLPPSTGDTGVEPIHFAQNIALNSVCFQYDDRSVVIRNVDITIPKGARIGIVGPTGSGKSTLLDVIMGLLQPTKGQLLVDGVAIDEKNRRSWQAHISHVPQNIFLIDGTIEENIAFGLKPEEVDHDRVRAAASTAQIAEIIESWPLQYQTRVGERGTHLSGGQRQRIGIARALYRNTDVLILDEATSALDLETERQVIHAIENWPQRPTIFMVSHRTATLGSCHSIVTVRQGEATESVAPRSDTSSSHPHTPDRTI